MSKAAMPGAAAAETDDDVAGEAPEPTGSRSALWMRIAALGFVVSVVLGECVVAYLLISRTSPSSAAAPGVAADEKVEEPKAEVKAEHGKGGSGHQGGTATTPSDGESDHAVGDLVEIDLEQFAVTAHQPTSNTTTRIEFHLFGMISNQDKEEFERLLKASQHRFREQVLMTVRRAEATDLADAGLGLIKRQILEKTNILLGKPLLRAIVVSDFSYLEQ